MKIIFEQDVEHTDFLELILSRDELDQLEMEPVVKEVKKVLHPKRTLNICLRLSNQGD